MLPASLDAVLDVDVPSLRRLDIADQLLKQLPDGVQRSLGVLSGAPLTDLDALAVGLTGLGTQQPDWVLVGRGRLGEEHLREAMLLASPGVAPVEYHGSTLLEAAAGAGGPPTPLGALGQGRSAAMLTSRTAVLGSQALVRQVVDNLHGDGNSARTQAELMAALSKAPRAKRGRPAVLLALVPPGPLRERLRQDDMADLGADASYVAAALAVGDGIDLGVVAGFAGPSAARDVAQLIEERVQALRKRPSVTLLRLGRFLDPFVVVAGEGGPRHDQAEVHIAYRLPGADLLALLDRIRRFEALRERIQKAPPGPLP